MTEPVFVVVGHPNKGKSSIVSTLAQDDTVRIAPEPGTTIAARRFPMRVDGCVLYTLVDTPGFQRARRVLHWLQQHATSVAHRPNIVRQFVEAHRGSQQFFAECELLGPIVEGGGILYVVDGSKPFGPEYEPEMEILRWTGRPSMALINPIDGADYIDQWEAALGQYFKIVRMFNALTTEFDKRLELLRAFGQLNENWRRPMALAVESLERDWQHRRQLVAEAIADMLIDMLTLAVAKNLTTDDNPEAHYGELERQYKDKLRGLENQCRDAVEHIYNYERLERQDSDVTVLETDLFSEDSWHLFGQSKWRLVTLGMAGGAATGALIDASVGGASFLMGTALGGAIGGALGWQAATWSANFQLFNLPGMEKLGLSGKRLQCGPTTNRNLPYVALGRARLHHRLIAQRTHAQRDMLVVDAHAHKAGAMHLIPDEQGKQLERLLTRLRKAGNHPERAWEFKEALADQILLLLERDVE